MGNTYETDTIERRDEITLAVQSAIIMKSLSHLVGCKSWLLARLSLKDIRRRVDEIEQTITKGSKETT